MAGLVVKLGLGETRGSYVKPGNSGSTVWSIQTLANFSKLVLKFNMHYDVGHWPGLCQSGLIWMLKKTTTESVNEDRAAIFWEI